MSLRFLVLTPPNPRCELWQIGKVLSQDTLKAALEVLPDDLPLDPTAPGGMIEYRRTMSASFFFKFFLSAIRQATPDQLDPADLRREHPCNATLLLHDFLCSGP